MKGLFYKALEELDSWEKQGKSKEDILYIFENNRVVSEGVTPSLSEEFVTARALLNRKRKTAIYQMPPTEIRAILKQDGDYLLPEGDEFAQERELAKAQIEWGVVKLIEIAYLRVKEQGEEFPFATTKQKLQELYELCIPKDVNSWEMVFGAESKFFRNGFKRQFQDNELSALVRQVFNEVLFIAYGFGADVKLEVSTEDDNTLLAIGKSGGPYNEIDKAEREILVLEKHLGNEGMKK